MTKEQGAPKVYGFIDVKKHFATSNCPIYDVMLYIHPKGDRPSGILYSKIKFEEVKKLLAQGYFRPTKLSEALFEKKFEE